jgi:hypothetical protein
MKVFLATRVCAADSTVFCAWIEYHVNRLRSFTDIEICGLVVYNRQSEQEEEEEKLVKALTESFGLTFLARVMAGWDNHTSMQPIEEAGRQSNADRFIYLDCDEFLSDVSAFVSMLRQIGREQALVCRMIEFIPKPNELLDDTGFTKFEHYDNAATYECNLLQLTGRARHKTCGTARLPITLLHNSSGFDAIYCPVFLRHYSFRKNYVAKAVKRIGTLRGSSRDWSNKIVKALAYFGYDEKGNRFMTPTKFERVGAKGKGQPSWFNYPDVYSEIAKFMPEKGGTFVELGVFHGRSIAYLCESLELLGKDTSGVYGIDVFDRSIDGECPWMHSVQKEHQLMGIKPTLIKQCSWEAAARFELESVDALWVDADHTYRGVLNDLVWWMPRLKKNAYLAGHDINLKAVRDALSILDIKYKKVGRMSWVRV